MLIEKILSYRGYKKIDEYEDNLIMEDKNKNKIIIFIKNLFILFFQ